MNPHLLRRSALTALLALLLGSPAQAGIYMNLSGIPGTSDTIERKDWIDLQSVQWGVGVGISSAVGGANREVSRPSFSDIVWSQDVDTSVPLLMNRLLSRQSIDKSTIDLVAPAQQKTAGKPYLQLETKHVAITGVSLANTSVSASQAYNSFSMSYDPIAFGQDKGDKVIAEYDLVTGKGTLRGAVPAAADGSQEKVTSGIYMRLGSGDKAIAGSSQAENYENWIRIDSAQFGVGAAYGAGQARPGVPSLSELTITQAFDQTVPVVFHNLVSGQSIGQTVIDYVQSGQNGQPVTFMRLVLEDVLFSSLSLSTGGDLPYVSETLNFSKFSQTVWQIGTDGLPGESTSAGYDLESMKSIGALQLKDAARFGNGLAYLAASGSTDAPPTAPAPIPEPRTALMMLAGIGVLATVVRRRRMA